MVTRTATPEHVDRLRAQIEQALILAEELDFTLVAAWLGHALDGMPGAYPVV